MFIFEMFFRMWWYDTCHLRLKIIELNTDKVLCFVIFIKLTIEFPYFGQLFGGRPDYMIPTPEC